ncbi:hypothetical protein CYMTET_3760 [Cymbomonas tetramitiformis]|uniref:Uncharacterized protein n=1 Tax=Cymbomonas tetramitiformis TaxID=36881 RepID=A0AAE0H4E8_9CHLO|nr:hypothetical protein CYMTET_3760 [Cymbomonas tetramitiformis]
MDFAAAEAYGAPEILSGEQAGGLDLSAYGFAVEGRVDTCEQDQRDPELVRLSREVDEAAARCGEASTLAFKYAGSDGEDAAPPTHEALTEAWLAEADRVCAGSEAVAQRGRQTQADARERAVQESLAARKRSVTAALAAQSRNAEELFVPVTEQPNDEKKNGRRQAVVPARCSEAAPQPVGCGTPPFGASQRLMWTVCMLSVFLVYDRRHCRQMVVQLQLAVSWQLVVQARTSEDYNDNAAGFGDEDEYED